MFIRTTYIVHIVKSANTKTNEITHPFRDVKMSKIGHEAIERDNKSVKTNEYQVC